MNTFTPGIRLMKARALATTSAIALAASAFAAPHAAMAADAPQTAQAPVEEIVVTGSRVVRDGYEAPTPVSVMGVEQIKTSATPTSPTSSTSCRSFARQRDAANSPTLTSGAVGVNPQPARPRRPPAPWCCSTASATPRLDPHRRRRHQRFPRPHQPRRRGHRRRLGAYGSDALRAWSTSCSTPPSPA
jgi:hypothetical protein